MIKAQTLTISERGFSLKITGKETPPVGEMFDINVNNSPLKAQVIWSFHQPEDPVDLLGARIVKGTLSFLS